MPPQQRYEAVLFDLDGTLIDSVADIAAAASQALVRLERRALPLERVRHHIGRGARNLIDGCLQEVDGKSADDDTLDRALLEFLEVYGSTCLERTDFYPGLRELLSKLDVPLAVVSNKPGDLCRRILEGLDASERFTTILGAGDFAERKPSPIPIQDALRTLGTNPRSTVMVGDGPPDILSARAAGCPSIGVLWGIAPRDELLACEPDRVAGDIEQLESILLAEA